LTKIAGPFRVNSQEAVKALESCAGRVNPRGLRVPAVAGRVRKPALLSVRVRVELAAGRVRVVLGAGAG